MGRKIFIQGIKGSVPLALTFVITYWLLNSLENLFHPLVRLLIGDQYYFWGMGLVFGLVLIYFLGLILNFWLVEKLHEWVEKVFKKIPLVKTIYNAILDVANYLDKDQSSQGNQVVMVTVPGAGNLIGIVTKTKLSITAIKENMQNDETLCVVYVPMSYQVGGFSLIVPYASVTPINMDIETAMRFTLTAGVAMKDGA